MLKYLQNLLKDARQDMAAQQTGTEHLRLTAAALMMEVGLADFDLDSQELQVMRDMLGSRFKLSHEQITELLQAANDQVRESTDLYHFTAEINRNWSLPEKFQLYQWLWQIAYADGVLSEHEHHLLRKLAGLLYIPHAEYVRCKIHAHEQQQSIDNRSSR